MAIVGDHAPDGSKVPFVPVANPRRALALAAAKFFPAQPATIAAVTGTSGKTSVAAFTRQIWERLGHASASIGTIGLVSPRRTVYGSLTTPDPIALHRQLDEIAREGVTHSPSRRPRTGSTSTASTACVVAAGGSTIFSRDPWTSSDRRALSAAKLACSSELVPADGAAVISADHDCSAEAINAARSPACA